jgi:hypothetical protein
MADDFMAVLARAQSDYSFYVQCQTDSDTALAAYSLRPEQRAALTDPGLLAEALKRERDLTITVSGKHDWVNRTPPKKRAEADELVARVVESVKQGASDAEREESVLRLMQLLG